MMAKVRRRAISAAIRGDLGVVKHGARIGRNARPRKLLRAVAAEGVAGNKSNRSSLIWVPHLVQNPYSPVLDPLQGGVQHGDFPLRRKAKGLKGFILFMLCRVIFPIRLPWVESSSSTNVIRASSSSLRS
jgi:hypothetical protein